MDKIDEYLLRLESGFTTDDIEILEKLGNL